MFYESTFCESIFGRWCVAMVALTMSLQVASACAAVDSPAELLERAIYQEETVGDLNNAIEGYQEIVAVSSASIDVAAEAQYRIGACLALQGKTKEANEAFEKVAETYPASKAWVEKAKEQLAKSKRLLPVPWGDGDELHMHMKLLGGKPAGYQVYRVAKTKVDGQDCWECQSWQTVTLNNAGGKSRVVADLDSFAPIESQWSHNMLGTASGEFSSSEVAIELVGRDEVKTLELDPPVYDNEQAAQVFRRLPLAKGYEGKIDIVSTLGQTLIQLDLKVDEIETVKVPAGKYECFKLELSLVNQTFWISMGEKREIVKFEAGGVESELVEVRPSDAKPKTIGGDRFSMTLPEGWHAYIPGDAEDFVHLIEPDNSIGIELRTRKIEKAKKKFDSPEASLKDFVGDLKEKLKNVTAKASDIKTVTIGGHPAAKVEYQFDGSNKKRVYQRNVLVYGAKFTVDLKFTCPAENLDSQQAKMDQLVDCLKLD